MSIFSYEIRNDIAWVLFDSGGMNTLAKQAIIDLNALRADLDAVHAKTPLRGVIMKGNRFGLGAGANIGELLAANKEQLAEYIDTGHQALYGIEDGPYPWLAVIDGFALGGIYELALACHGIIATPKSTVGFPELKLNIFPGLGGTQRMPRRSGLLNTEDPISGDAGFTAVLQAKNFRAPQAAKINMVDALVPEGSDIDEFAEDFLLNTLPTIDRTPPADLANGEALREMMLPVIHKATGGRDNPRAPFVALDVMIRGGAVSLKEGNQIERDEFLELASGPEAKAGMRFFFTQQGVHKLPKSFPGTAHELTKIGVDGIDGYMGNAIGYLAMEAGYEVVGHAPLAKFAGAVGDKLRAKYKRAVKKGKLTEAQVEEKIAAVTIASEDPAALADCDLVIEARMENREIKSEFYRALGGVVKKGAIVASNSSSMGPGMLSADFAAAGGKASNFLNLHFFSPAEHPAMQLVEIVCGADTDDDAVATAHAFVRKIGKTPVILGDGSAGFLVNAGLAAYFGAAEELYREGTPIDVIDAAIRKDVLPMGPFELSDQAGIDIGAGMFDTMATEKPPTVDPLVWKLRELKRLGVKSGAGFYDYDGASRTSEWDGLAGLVEGRGSRVAGEDEIVERCMRALYEKTRELIDRGVARSEEEADLAFVFGIGFSMHLGGPIYYGKLKGFDRA
jgi:3-hydroxyacyl-CoA dehydrogenase